VNREMTGVVREVRLSAALCAAAEQKFGARFGGLESFLNSVLQELVREDAARLDEEERRIIEERLKDLGYI
jgi:hypothetical protein